MNLSGKHFEFAGVPSSDPLGDGSVSLIFAHIDTEMFKQPFGYPEYSSVYSGRLGRRGLTGTNRSESCFEFEQEIVSEKNGIPLNKLRRVEQWLFSREAFAKLYIAEDEEDEEDVQYMNGEKKRLYLNCMLTEPEILTYSEGKVGWKVKVVCDAPWAWQDEHTQTIYVGADGWYQPLPLGTEITETGAYYRRVGNEFVEASTLTIAETLASFESVEYDGVVYTDSASVYVPPSDTVTLAIDVTNISMGPYGYVEINGVQVAQKNYDGSGVPSNFLTYEYVIPEGCICVVRRTSRRVSEDAYASGISVTTTEQVYELIASGSTSLPTVYVESDVNDYIYPDRSTIVLSESAVRSIFVNISSSVSDYIKVNWYGTQETDDFDVDVGDSVSVAIPNSVFAPFYRIYFDGELVSEGEYDPQTPAGGAYYSFEVQYDYTIASGWEDRVEGDVSYPVLCAYITKGSDEHYRTIALTNATDDVARKTEFSHLLRGIALTIIISNNGLVTDSAGNNLMPYMSSRYFPRLTSNYVDGQIGLNGANRLSLEGDIKSVAFTFRNRRFLT